MVQKLTVANFRKSACKKFGFSFFGIVCAWDLVEDNILKLQMSD